jgi:hypothetical protein
VICEIVGSSGDPNLVSGDTGGEMGNVALTIDCIFLILDSITSPELVRCRLSRGRASGGDMRLFVMPKWFLRSIIVNRFGVDRMELIDEVDGVGVCVDEFANGFVTIGDCLRSKEMEGCRIEVNVLSSMFVCLRPRAKLWQDLQRTFGS